MMDSTTPELDSTTPELSNDDSNSSSHCHYILGFSGYNTCIVQGDSVFLPCHWDHL